MKNFIQLALFIFIFYAFNSCSDTNGKSEINQVQEFKAIVTDSVVFEWLPEVQMLDYNEKTEELLLLDRTSKEILVIDNKGQLVSQFNPHVEGPNYVGDYDFGWIFYGEDQLMCYGTYYFHLLDKEGNRVKRFTYPVETNGLWSLDYDPRMLWDYDQNGDTKFVAFITAPAGPSFREPEYYDSVHMVYSIDVETETAYSIMHKPESSTYKNLEGYVDHGWPYMSNYKGSRFAQIRSVDSMLYIWDAEENKLLNSIVIPSDSQPEYEVFSFDGNGKPDIFKKNAILYTTKDYILLHSMGQIPESVERSIREAQFPYRETDEYKQAVKRYMTSEYLVFDEERYLGKLINEVGQTSYGRLNTKKDFIWMVRRYPDERDYRTFLKVKIVTVD